MEADYRCQVVRVRTPGQRVRCIPFSAWTWWDDEEMVPTTEEQAAADAAGKVAQAAVTERHKAGVARATEFERGMPPDSVLAQQDADAANPPSAQQLANQQGQMASRKGK